MIYYNFSRDKNIVEKYNKNTGILHIGLDFNVDPMSAVVCVIENDRIFIIDEIQYIVVIRMKCVRRLNQI